MQNKHCTQICWLFPVVAISSQPILRSTTCWVLTWCWVLGRLQTATTPRDGQPSCQAPPRKSPPQPRRMEVWGKGASCEWWHLCWDCGLGVRMRKRLKASISEWGLERRLGGHSLAGVFRTPSWGVTVWEVQARGGNALCTEGLWVTVVKSRVVALQTF